jgi:hypothetical protein
MAYYVAMPASDEDGNMMGVTYTPDHPARSCVTGRAWSDSPSAKPWEQPPSEPVRLARKHGREEAPFPSLLREPVPLVSDRLLVVLRAAGVDNLEVYRAELRYADGRVAADDYHVFDLVGLVRGADLGKSSFDRSQSDRSIAMGSTRSSSTRAPRAAGSCFDWRRTCRRS